MEIQSVKQRFGIVGDNPALNYALSVAVRVAPTNLTILITGESGVGKDIFSNIIHQLSPRKHNPIIAVNCGAIPEGTIDSELFGHEKGSFTGAVDKRKGYFESVNGGTIFLDEIGEMPLSTQARLLRVLENGDYIKVGSSQVQKTDVRIVAATNVDLKKKIEEGKFREDLFYRLSTVPIEIPPLRERGQDIHLLFRKFAADFAEKNRVQTIRLTEDAVQLISKYNWPGNIRQLKNVAEKVSVLATEKSINGEQLKFMIKELSGSKVPSFSSSSSESDYTERELLYKMLFEIKKDMNDIKHYLFNMNGGTEIIPEERGLPMPKSDSNVAYQGVDAEENERKAVIIHNPEQEFRAVEAEEESLSIADKEKELIVLALKKHKGKRKDAASDLGISERTLYRKIKEYEIEE